MKIIYICGMGHNGSTILNLALGMSSGVLATSQLNDLLCPFDLESDGLDVSERAAGFWRKVLAKLTDAQKSRLKIAHQSNFQERKILHKFFSNHSREVFCADCQPLFKAIVEVSGKSVIIDSSKNVSRAISLANYKEDNAEVYYVHLIRDVRGYVNSKNKRSKENNFRNRYLLHTIRWVTKNAFASILLRSIRSRVLKVHYEDIVMRPDEFLDRLEKFTSEKFPTTRRALKGEIEIHPTESIGFNGNRLLKSKQSRFRTGHLPSDGVFQSNAYWYTLGWIASFWGYKRDRNARFQLDQTETSS